MKLLSNGGVNGNRPGRWGSGRGVWVGCRASGWWGLGSGGRIRTSDLWVMSPTSCHCSTPRQRTGAARQIRVRTGNGGRPQRPRLPTRRRVSTLRRCRGSRPGSGWDRVGPRRSRPRAPRIPRTHTDSLWYSSRLGHAVSGTTAPTTKIISTPTPTTPCQGAYSLDH
jgi:hypothetical protein